MFSSNRQDWETPQEFFNKLNKEFNFNLDPCADSKNYKCDKYFTEKIDGLKQDWGGYTVFVNPPYGREIGKWIEKAYIESKKGATVVMLIPARTDTKYWHDYVMQANEIRFIKGRLRFVGSKNAAPFPSAIVIFKNVKEKLKVVGM